MQTLEKRESDGELLLTHQSHGYPSSFPLSTTYHDSNIHNPSIYYIPEPPPYFNPSQCIKLMMMETSSTHETKIKDDDAFHPIIKAKPIQIIMLNISPRHVYLYVCVQSLYSLLSSHLKQSRDVVTRLN